MRRHAPGVYGLPGAALFLGGALLTADLLELYRRNAAPVAYLDESYELGDHDTFYIVSCVLVYPDEIADTRDSLMQFYAGEAMHASAMWRNREVVSLEAGIELAAAQHDGADVVVCAPVADDDRAFGAAARAACLDLIAPMLQREADTRLFVFDRLDTPTAERRDQATFADLRRAGVLNRSTAVTHVRPSEEPILGLPDLIAWSFRQEQTQRSSSWFDPFREHTRVHRLP